MKALEACAECRWRGQRAQRAAPKVRRHSSRHVITSTTIIIIIPVSHPFLHHWSNPGNTMKHTINWNESLIFCRISHPLASQYFCCRQSDTVLLCELVTFFRRRVYSTGLRLLSQKMSLEDVSSRFKPPILFSDTIIYRRPSLKTIVPTVIIDYSSSRTSKGVLCFTYWRCCWADQRPIPDEIKPLYTGTAGLCGYILKIVNDRKPIGFCWGASVEKKKHVHKQQVDF